MSVRMPKGCRRRGLATLSAILLALPCWSGVSADAVQTTNRSQYVCTIHVHSKNSGGGYSLPELTDVARKAGTDVLFLTDNLTVQCQYAIWPFRNTLWYGRSEPGIVRLGAK